MPALTPPPSGGRLFVGGVPASVSDAALLSLLAPFGRPTHLARHSARGFAHVTLLDDSQGPGNNVENVGAVLHVLPRTASANTAAERCARSLNRTLWRGGTLRVEKARTHYLNRLQDEWKTMKDSSEGSACIKRGDSDEDQRRKEDGENADVEASASRKNGNPVGKLWKGKHIHFSELDDETTGHLQPLRSTENASADNGEKVEKSVQLRRPRTSSAFQSTMSLFGLSSTPQTAPLPPEDQSNVDDAPDGDKMHKDDPSPPIALSPSPCTTRKRTRASRLEEGGDSAGEGTKKSDVTSVQREKRGRRAEEAVISMERAQAVGNDASLIDLSAERSAAMAVFSSMFSAETASSPYAPPLRDGVNDNKNAGVGVRDHDCKEMDGVSCGRTGLFRRLPVREVPKDKGAGHCVGNGAVTRRKRGRSGFGGLQVKGSEVRDANVANLATATSTASGVTTVTKVEFKETRRAGLYRQLGNRSCC